MPFVSLNTMEQNQTSLIYFSIKKDLDKFKHPSLLTDSRVLDKPYSVSEVFDFVTKTGGVSTA